MATSHTTADYPNDAFRAALAMSMLDGTFTDTAYHLYSKRIASGKIGAPRTIHACSAVLKSAGEYFCAELSGGFSTNESVFEETDCYGYDSDSDIDDSEFLENEHKPNDEALINKAQEKNVAEAGRTAAHTTEINGKSEHKQDCEVESTAQSVVKYSVRVPDIAADTWHALIYYIYTGTVYFAPLISEGRDLRRQAIDKHLVKMKCGPSLCSPKSMYRLADIIGLTKLKKLAEYDIKCKLSAKTIVEEVFSRFSSNYPEILETQLQFLYTDAMMAQVMTGIQSKIQSVIHGEIPHAENVLLALLQKLSSFTVERPLAQASSSLESSSTTSQGQATSQLKPKPSTSPPSDTYYGPIRGRCINRRHG